jgi:hypothetical protein
MKKKKKLVCAENHLHEFKNKKKLVCSENHLHEFKNFKNSVNNFCHDNNVIDIISDMCIRTNTIIRHTYYFIKLYFNHLFQNNIKFPLIDLTLLRYIYTFTSTIKSERNCKTSNKSIADFNESVFAKLNLNNVSRDGLTQILYYESEIIVTCIENNIKCHFYKRFSKYVNVLYSYSQKKEKINNKKISDDEKKEKIKELNQIFYDIKTGILSMKKINDKNDHKKFIMKIRTELFYHIKNIHENGIMYDIQIQPQEYLYPMFKIINDYERINEDNKNIPNFEQIRLFSSLPLRRTLIPRYITIDTEIIIQNFKDLLKDKLHEIDKDCKNIEDLRNNFCKKKLHNKIWNVIFDMKNKFFKEKSKYKFDYMLKTNNIACSAQFTVKTELKKKYKIVDFKMATGAKYVDDIPTNNRFAILGKKKVACIDPNKRDMIYCGTYKDDNFVNFRYTQCQRQVETKSKKYRKIRNTIQKEKINLSTKDEKLLKEYAEKTIKQVELMKTKYCTNTVNMKKMRDYLVKCEPINEILKPHYEEKIYRKLGWNVYMNMERSEAKMINNFSEKIGNKDTTTVIVGDYSVHSTNMRGTIPAISKKIIKIFKRYGYEVYLINEYNTSKLCNECCSKTEKFHKRKSQKPKLKGQYELVHGLLRCQSSECEIIHNRDKNAVKNMLKIVKSIKEKGERPKEYCRKITRPYQSALVLSK